MGWRMVRGSLVQTRFVWQTSCAIAGVAVPARASRLARKLRGTAMFVLSAVRSARQIRQRAAKAAALSETLIHRAGDRKQKRPVGRPGDEIAARSVLPIEGGGIALRMVAERGVAARAEIGEDDADTAGTGVLVHQEGGWPARN